MMPELKPCIQLGGQWRLEEVEGRWRIYHPAYNGHSGTFATAIEAKHFAAAMTRPAPRAP